jgi:crotonobetaine/carnitine-CoA ligase
MTMKGEGWMSLITARTGREAWRARAEATPERVFLRDGGRAWTFGELDIAQRRHAAGLAAVGVRAGDRVAVGMSNRAETVMVRFALQELGAVAVPLPGELTLDELAYRVNHSGAGVLVADGTIASLAASGSAGLPAVTTMVLDGPAPPPGVRGLSLAELGAPGPLEPRQLPGHTDRDPAMVLYTSGSTGRPKGVVLGAGVLPSAGRAFAGQYGLTEDDNFILPLTMGHAIGAITAPAIATMAGATLSLMGRFRPSAFWTDVADNGATVSILFPAHLSLLMETAADAPRAGETGMRLIITHQWKEDFRQRFGIELALVWGMTETGALSTGSQPGYHGQWEGYVGHPMRGVEVGIFDDGFRRLGPGRTGEIALRHEQVMLGYLDDPEATAATLVDGWVRSGDYGTVDEAGRLFFRGRLKNMIKRSGENISAEEVQDALAGHPDVIECLVFGVPDRLRTEEVAAVAVTRDEVAPEEIIELASKRLSRLKLPRYLAIRREPLARLGNGKIDLTAIRRDFDVARAWDRLSPAPAPDGRR